MAPLLLLITLVYGSYWLYSLGNTVEGDRLAYATHPNTVSIDKRELGFLLGCGALLAALYAPVIIKLVNQWMVDANYRHGVLIPFISAFMLWRKRGELRTAPGGGGEIFGLSLILLSAALLIVGAAASEFFTARLSLPFVLLGAAFFLRGRAFARAVAFPVLFLVMMIPIPYVIYYKVTFPFQLMSARVSAKILGMIGLAVLRRGNVLLLPNYALEVVAACSGLRSLMTMVTIALVIAAFTELGAAKKVILVAAAVPVAIAANTLRLVVTAIGAYTVGAEFADGFLHTMSGIIVFIAGLAMLIAIMGILRWIK
jgi:exosortase